MPFRAVLQRRLWVIALTAALFTALTAALLHERTPEAPAPEEPGDPAVVAPTDAPYATLGEWEGRLAVFFGEADRPGEVYEVYVASLPEGEQETLRKGLPVPDEETLQRRLEDYLS